MATILQVLCPKGGVGKSMMAIVVLHILKTMGKQVLLIETDPNNPDVAQAHRREVDTEAINLAAQDGWLVLATTLDRHFKAHGAAGWVVINGRAAADLDDLRHYSRSFWRAANELRCRVVTLWVITADYEPVRQLWEYLETVPREAPHNVHVVKNHYFAPERRFPYYEGSDIRKSLEAGGSKTIDLPAMVERNRALIYSERWSIRKILEEGDYGCRMEMEVWVDDVAAALRPVIDA